MDVFIARENIKQFKLLLEAEADEAKRTALQKLLG
jgi:hypothetical protein